MVDMKADIIVIGAGIAGLTAASQLQKSGQSVLVLEARERMGGRIFSQHIGQDTYDLGASWIHGIEDNPIWDITRQHHIQTEVFNYQESIFFKENGHQFNAHEQQVLETALAHLMTKFTNLTHDSHYQNAQQVLDEWLVAEDLLSILKPEKGYESRYQAYLLAFFNVLAEDPFASSLSELSPYFLQFEGYHGGDEVIFPQGYAQVIHYIAQGLDIRLNQIVQAIDYQGEDVCITTTEGMCYRGKQVVVAVPLGVLKQECIQFYPPLPDDKQQAIRQLGFGVFNKLFVSFDTVFWQKAKDGHGSTNSVFVLDGNHWLNFMDVSAIYQQPTLLFLFGGASATWLENSSDEKTWKQLSASLTKAFGPIPQPLAFIKTEWGQDQFAYGSFAYPACGFQAEHILTLQAPILSKVFFAGEHLMVEGAGTVHGAYESGVAVVRHIMQPS